MIAWAGGSLLAVSLLIALVLLVRRPVAHAFGPRAAFALWLAPAARAVMLPLPQELAIPSPVPAGTSDYWLATAASGAASPSLAPLLVALWLAGAALMLGLHWWRHQRFLAAAVAGGEPFAAPVPCKVIATAAIDGPAATGLLRPLILVPLDFTTRFSPAQQLLALWHEQLHHRRGDLWASAAALLLLSLLWFNPLAHVALRAFRRDMEAACDAQLLAEAGRDAAPAYAETILRCAARPVPRSLCALTTLEELKGRLSMIKLNHGRGRRAAGLVIAAALSGGGLLLALPAAAEEGTEQVQEITKKVVIKHVGDRDVVKRAEPGDLEALGAKCTGEKIELAADGGTAERKEQVKFVLCPKAGQSRAEIVKQLEKAAADLAKQDEMPAGVKAELLAKLRSKIDQMRAGG